MALQAASLIVGQRHCQNMSSFRVLGFRVGFRALGLWGLGFQGLGFGLGFRLCQALRVTFNCASDPTGLGFRV